MDSEQKDREIEALRAELAQVKEEVTRVLEMTGLLDLLKLS